MSDDAEDGIWMRLQRAHEEMRAKYPPMPREIHAERFTLEWLLGYFGEAVVSAGFPTERMISGMALYENPEVRVGWLRFVRTDGTTYEQQVFQRFGVAAAPLDPELQEMLANDALGG